MTPLVKLAGFAALLAGVFAAAAILGRLVEPRTGTADEPKHTEEKMSAEATRFEAGVVTPYVFRIVDEGGKAVRSFDVEHDRPMHLIVVRRDMEGFQHLHPRQRADGSWITELELPAAGGRGPISFGVEYPSAGRYRLFLQFQHDGRVRTAEFVQEVAQR